jgi:hypothetical protein
MEEMKTVMPLIFGQHLRSEGVGFKFLFVFVSLSLEKVRDEADGNSYERDAAYRPKWKTTPGGLKLLSLQMITDKSKALNQP